MSRMMLNPRARNQDRISELPDAVIGHILSSLRTVEATRTMILSKKWKKMWVYVLSLDFDNKRDFGTDMNGFITFVSRVLYLRDSSDIYKLRLKVSFHKYKPVVEDWIYTAVGRNVVELDLESVDYGFDFPECILTCKTLRVLKLKLSQLVSANIPTSGCFPSLKFLHITIFNPEEQVMQKLFSCCPVLEDLTIDGTIEGYPPFAHQDDYNFKITAPELKTLRMYLVNIDDPVNVHVDAPKLENLDLKRHGLIKYFLMRSATSLVYASIAFSKRSEFEGEDQLALSNCAMELLGQVSNVKCLSLSVHCLEDWHLPKDWHLPAFGNVNQLRLVLCDCSYWEFLAEFLNSAPNLEDFVLEYRTKGTKKISKVHWNPPKDVPICLSSPLKTISLKGFQGLPVEMEMIQYLLKNGHVLNKVVISTSLHLSYAKQYELYMRIMMFDKATTCHVEFMQIHNC